MGRGASEPGAGQGPRPPAGALMPPRPRRRVNCSEYFPLFLATLWVAGIFFHEGLVAGKGPGPGAPGDPAPAGSPGPRPALPGAAALCGLVYLFARLRYFQGYSLSVQQR